MTSRWCRLCADVTARDYKGRCASCLQSYIAYAAMTTFVAVAFMCMLSACPYVPPLGTPTEIRCAATPVQTIQPETQEERDVE